MTENEAIEYVKNMAFMCGEYEKCQYGHQCTTKCLKATKMAIQALEEIQQYRAIGTIDEFKALKEKNEPKSRIIKNGKYYCCSCDRFARTSGHCSHCGQMLY